MSRLRALNVLRRRWKRINKIAAQERRTLDSLITTLQSWRGAMDITIGNLWDTTNALETDIAALTTRIEVLESKADIAQTKFQQIQAAIQDFEARISALEGS